jgi:hypothetical protein
VGSRVAIVSAAPRSSSAADASEVDESFPVGQAVAANVQTNAAQPLVADRSPDATNSTGDSAADLAPANAPVAQNNGRTAVTVLNVPDGMVATRLDTSFTTSAARALPLSPSPAGEQGTRASSSALATGRMQTPPQELGLSSRGADLLASFLPFDRTRVEQAIDHILAHLDALDAGVSQLGTTANLVPILTATGVTIAATRIVQLWGVSRWDWIRRPLSAALACDASGNADADAFFPGLPGSPFHWSGDAQ